jgi:hypothetical protein
MIPVIPTVPGNQPATPPVAPQGPAPVTPSAGTGQLVNPRPDAPSLQIGQAIDAVVIGRDRQGTLQLQVGGEMLQLRTPLALEAGTKVQLQVQTAGGQVLVALTPQEKLDPSAPTRPLAQVPLDQIDLTLKPQAPPAPPSGAAPALAGGAAGTGPTNATLAAAQQVALPAEAIKVGGLLQAVVVQSAAPSANQTLTQQQSLAVQVQALTTELASAEGAVPPETRQAITALVERAATRLADNPGDSAAARELGDLLRGLGLGQLADAIEDPRVGPRLVEGLRQASQGISHGAPAATAPVPAEGAAKAAPAAAPQAPSPPQGARATTTAPQAPAAATAPTPQPTPAPIAVANSVGATVVAPAAAPDGTVPALPTGARVDLRVLAVATPESPAGAATVAASGKAPTLSGVVAGTNNAGQPVLRTPAGVLALNTVEALPPGTRIDTEVLGVALPRDLAVEGDARPQSLLGLSHDWNTLEQALPALQQQPGAANFLQNVLPQPGPKLAAQMMFFMAALQVGDVKAWLGDGAVQGLQRAGKGRLVQRMGEEFQQMGRAAEAAGEWRGFFIPIFDGQKMQQIRVFSRSAGEDETDKDDPENTVKSRFLVDVELTRLGALQVDGLVRRKRLDLVVRTRAPLPEEMRRDLHAIFGRTAGATGIEGSITFQVVRQMPPLPLADVAGHAPAVVA